MREIGEESFITFAAERGEWYLISRLRERGETIGDGNNHVGTREITLGGGESGGRRKLGKTSKKRSATDLDEYFEISTLLPKRS